MLQNNQNWSSKVKPAVVFFLSITTNTTDFIKKKFFLGWMNSVLRKFASENSRRKVTDFHTYIIFTVGNKMLCFSSFLFSN